MSRRDHRKRIEEGIYDDGVQYVATIRVRGARFKEKRFPYGTPLDQVEQWRRDTRIQLLMIAKRGSAPGSFERDAKKYLRDFTQHLASKADRQYDIERWIARFRHRPRGTITPADIARARVEWMQPHTEDDKTRPAVKPKTINNRVNALRHLYHCLDGHTAWTPCDDLEPLEVHKTPIRVVPDALILKVDQTLQQLEKTGAIRSAKTRARFRVLVSTGRRASELMRTEPGDVDLTRRVWIVRDGKGGFSPGLYLNDDMLAAWHLFIEADAWGAYDTQKQAERLRRAGWPSDIRPYNARHAVGMTLSEQGVDLADIAPLMGHKRIETTRRAYVPVLNSRLQKASESLSGRFARWLQTDLQTTRTRSEEVRPKSAPPTNRSTTTKRGKKR